jgi:hypothetical protein
VEARPVSYTLNLIGFTVCALLLFEWFTGWETTKKWLDLWQRRDEDD